jgi:hypothetical protein
MAGGSAETALRTQYRFSMTTFDAYEYWAEPC